jgi:hypothetical protein
MKAAFFITTITAQGTSVFTMGTSMKIIWPTSHGLDALRMPSSGLSPHAALVSSKKQWPTEHTEYTENPAHEVPEFPRISFVHRLPKLTQIFFTPCRGAPALFLCAPFPNLSNSPLGSPLTLKENY